MDQQIAFDKVKELLQSDALLVYFDCTKPLSVYADTSAYGVGAILAHKMPKNSEKPIAFASRTLIPAERNYSQLETEALAVIFAVKCFNQYLYGTYFTLYSDQKPLERLKVNFSKFLHWPEQQLNSGHFLLIVYCISVHN